MMRLAATALACIAGWNAAFAQLKTEAVTAPGGVSYLRVAMPEAQTQSLTLLWRDGTPVAGEGHPGLPAAVSFLMAREPKGEILGEVLETLRDYQAGFSFHAGADAGGLSISAPPEHFGEAVAIVKRFLDMPALPQDRLDTYRQDYRFRALQSLKRGDALAAQLRAIALLPDSPWRRYHLTDPARLDTVSAADVDRWRRNILAREGVVIVAAGPMEAAGLSGPIAALVADLPPAQQRSAPKPPAMRAAARFVALERAVPQTIVQAFGPTSIEWGLDFIKASMSIQRLGGGSQGRLHAALRDRLGATYGASVSIDGLSWQAYSVVVSTAVEHDKAGAVIATIREEYRRWWEEGMTEAEFAAVRSAMLGNRRDQRRQPGAVASTIANAVMRGAPQDYYAAYDAALEAVTREAVNAYIRRHFPRELSVVVVAPRAEGLGADCVIQSVEDAGRCGL